MNLNLNKFKLNLTAATIAIGLMLFSKFFTLTAIVGASRAGLSMINVTAPLVTLFGGVFGGVFGLVLNLLVSPKGAILLSHTGLPNFLAGLYWASNRSLVKLGLPVLLMGLFWSQTWGTLAAWYATLWLIPVVLYGFKFKALWLQALAATLVAHGTGSVLWLFFGKIPNAVWFGLMPIALLERICLSILMVGAYKMVHKLMALPKFAKMVGLLASKVERVV